MKTNIDETHDAKITNIDSGNDETKPNLTEEDDRTKRNIDEGYGEIATGLKRQKQMTLFEAYRISNKIKNNNLKQLSKRNAKH